MPETKFGKNLQRVVAIGLFEPQTSQRMGAFIRVGEYFAEMPGNALAVRVKNPEQGRPVGKSQRSRNQVAFFVACWEHVSLSVVQILQAMLEATQEYVGGDQFINTVRRQQTALDEQHQHF